MRHPLTSIALGFGMLGVSCLPGGKLPHPAPPPSRGASALRPQEAALPPDEGPLKLAFASPEGDEVEAPLPTFVFTRSMHRLGAAPDDPPVAATIDPPIEGSWRWIGARALQFSPRQDFPRATRFHLQVAPGLRSLDGQTLDQPLALDFATPRLKLLDISLGDQSNDHLFVSFNQEVETSVFEKAFSLVDEDGKSIPFRVEHPGRASSFALLPRPRWPLDVTIKATLAPMRGVEGNLGPKEPQQRTLRERPVTRVGQLSCSSERSENICEEETNISISLTEGLRTHQLRPLIRIDPPLPFKLEHYGNPNAPSDWFTLKAAFKKDTPYKVTVKASPRRRRGQPGLDVGAEYKFHTTPPEPSASLLLHGTYFHPSWTRELHATVERASSAHFSAAPLSLLEVLARLESRENHRASTSPPQGKSKDFTAPSGEDWQSVSLVDILPDKPGPLLLSASWKGSTGQGETSRLIQRSDLALSSRLSPERSLVWVTRLSTGLPLANAEVELHDAQGHKIQGRTDLQGLTSLDLNDLPAKPENESDALLLVARAGDDWVYQQLRRPRQPRLEGTLFTDRDIYRPGEQVYIKGVARFSSSAGPVPPEGREVTLSIQLPDQAPLTLSKKLSSWGTFAHELSLPPDIPPRNVRISLLDKKQTLFSSSIRVRHVREAAFKVTASLDRNHYLPGDSFTCAGQSVYLYGGSMQKMPYTATISARPSGYTPPGLDGFIAGDHRYENLKHTTARHRALDAEGLFKEEGTIADYTTSQMLRCGVSVTDPGQQVVEGEATAWIHPAEFYVALKPPRWDEPEAGKELKIPLLAVTHDGKRRAEKVTVELFEERPVEGKNEPDLVKISSCVVTTGEEANTCSLRLPTRYGVSYRAEATAKDSKNRIARTRTTFRVPDKPRPPPPPPPPPKNEPPPPPPLLSLDRNSYHPGDTAKVRVQPAAAFGRGLITVEREGIFFHKIFSASDSTIEIPISAGMAPYAYLSAALQRPLSTDIPYNYDHKAQERSGILFSVERPSRLLQITLQPSRTEAAPGDDISVDVTVNQAGGTPARAEVTLYAVNEGMLQLSDYQVPNLESKLPLEGEHLVLFQETRTDLGWLEKPLRGGTGTGQGFGSGHGRLGGAHSVTAPLATIRSDFRPTPLFLPTLETDEQGHAHASFKLPDSLTAYRIMAVAVSKDDRYGRGEASVTARLNAQIRPVIPQSVRAGDRFEVAAVAANNTTGSMTAKVSLEATGFHLASAEPKTIHLAPGASERVTFPVEARQVGQGKLTFHLDAGDGGKDTAEVPLQAQSPVSMEASALYGKTEQAVLESVADLSMIRGDVGGLELTVSSSPVSGLAPGLEQLVEYPYGCTEQLTSRLVPLVALRALAQGLGVALPEDTESASKKAVESVLKNRNKDGQFGLWPSSHPSPWITAYAYWGLSEANRHGIPVASEIFKAAATHLGEVGGRWAAGKKDAAEASFALDVLVDLPGVDDASRLHALILLRQMLDHRADLPLFARFQLLHALARLATPADELTPLVKEVEASLHLDGAVARVVEPTEWYPELLDSRIRSSAMALRALLAASPGHPMLEPLARGLIADRGPKGWRTTQETAWALLALDAYRRAQGGEDTALEAKVAVGSRSLLEATLQGLAAEKRAWVPMKDLVDAGGAGLLFETRGKGALHYQARLRYAPVQLPATGLFAGMEINRHCRALGEKEASAPDTFRVGQWVACEIEVITPSPRRFVVLDAPIPGGFELADPSLQGTPQNVRRQSYGEHTHKELRADGAVYFVDQLRGGVHSWSFVARAMTAGEFITPPTRIEEMYAPETYGRTAAAVVKILP